MDTLRAMVRWISQHRILSALGTAFFLVVLLLGNKLVSQSQGQLSDPLRKGNIVDAVYGIGTVTAAHSYAIKPGVIATIRELYVKEGDSVRKSAPLANIDNVVYRAPFNGVVNYLPFKVGENIFTQFPVLILTDLHDRYVVVSMEQQGALRVKSGQKAKLSFDSIRGQTFEGVVQSVYSYNGNFLARIDISDLPPEILPDMTADIAIIIRELDNALLIPVAALENNTVWVKRRISRNVPVRLGIVDSVMAEVVSGDVHEGDRVLIRRKPQ